MLLDLIQIINQKSRHINSSSIKIYTDNQKNINRVTKKVMKVNFYTQDAGAEIKMIKSIIKETKINIEIIQQRNYQK